MSSTCSPTWPPGPAWWCPRQELLTEVWRQSYGDDQTIDVHVSWLRRKLGETAARPRYLRTVRGVGVMLDPPR